MKHVYQCLTHRVLLIYDSETGKREIHSPPSRNLSMPRCVLATLKVLKAGTYGECVVVEKGEAK